MWRRRAGESSEVWSNCCLEDLYVFFLKKIGGTAASFLLVLLEAIFDSGLSLWFYVFSEIGDGSLAEDLSRGFWKEKVSASRAFREKLESIYYNDLL